MNKQEIQKQIDSISADRDVLERTRNKLTGDIALLLQKIAEAEKPKLGHGDFGITERRQFFFNDAKRNLSDYYPNQPIFEYENREFDGGLDEAVLPIKFGNIFNLMEGWDKDFKNVVMKNSYDGRVFLIQKSLLAEKDIYLGTEDLGHKMGVYLTIAEAKEICHALGHAIVDNLRQTK